VASWFRRRRAKVSQTTWDERAAQLRAAAQDRGRRLQGQEDAVAALEAMLFRHDPIGIDFENNTDEYRSESQTILLRRAEAKTQDELRRIVHEEFVRWFGDDIAGPQIRYDAIADELWASWSSDQQ
jgi:hypothetical protein